MSRDERIEYCYIVVHIEEIFSTGTPDISCAAGYQNFFNVTHTNTQTTVMLSSPPERNAA